MMTSTLVDVIRLRALNTPDQVACTFLNKDLVETMSYAQLNKEAQAIAATLQTRGIKPGDRVLLLFSPGMSLIQAFFGSLYAGCIAVPIYPPAQDKLLEKARRIHANASPRLVLMTADHLSKFTTLNKESLPCFDNIPAMASDTLDLRMAEHWQPTLLAEEDIAFLQYTSGSTMHPKGVMVSHRSLMDNLNKIYNAYAMNEETILFSWLPPHHDMGLIGSILTPLFGGVPVIMMSPFSFLQNPVSWLKNISTYQATISASPNFAYDYCVKRIKEEKKEGLDLSSWQVASNGAEPVRASTMEHFYQAFKAYGFRKEAFYPCYGLAEATLLVTGSTPGTGYKTLSLDKKAFENHQILITQESSTTHYDLVSCGRLIQTVKIVNPDHLSLCNADEVGEVWVKSPSVASGYWQQPEETKQAFHGVIAGDTSGDVYLRTGDLGFIHDEELVLTGRIKDLIILYGKNHYPQDIEYTLLHAPFHTQLGQCAAFVVQADNEYQLTVLCEVKNRFMNEKEQETLFESIFSRVYQVYQLEIHTIVLLPLKAIPQTTSGKIRRNFCRVHLLDGTLPIIANWRLQAIED